MADDGTPSDADDLAGVLQKILGTPARGRRRERVDCQAALLALIDDFLAGALTFEDLETQYSDCFIEELPEDELSAESFDFFAGIHEKLSWTGADVDQESRLYGWIDPTEFAEWLSAQRAAFDRNNASA